MPHARRGALGGRRARLSVRRQGAGPAGAARPLRRRGRAASSRPRSRRRSRRRAAAASSSRSSSSGREVTVNAFLLGGRFHALTVTDRHLAEPPAFGVALAHSWPSAQPTPQIAKAIDGGAQGRGGARDRRRADVHAGDRLGARARSSASSPRGSAAGTTRSSAAPRCGVNLNGLAISAALGEQVRATELAPQARVGGACVRFLVAPPGELRAVRGLDEAFAVDGVRGIRVYRKPGHVFGAAAQRRGPRRRDPRRRRLRRGGAGARRSRAEPRSASRSKLRARRRVERPASASSRPRSARRRSPPSRRRCAPAG